MPEIRRQEIEGSGHEGCKLRADTSDSMSGPRGRVSEPEGGHRPTKQRKNERMPQSHTSFTYFVMALFR